MTRFYWTDLRRSIVTTLRDREMRICELQQEIGSDYHLVLRSTVRMMNLGVIEREGEPRNYKYRVNQDCLTKVAGGRNAIQA